MADTHTEAVKTGMQLPPQAVQDHPDVSGLEMHGPSEIPAHADAACW